MTRVSIQGLVKLRDRVPVVDGASLDLDAGEMAYALGPPGAGKSTLARLVAGLEMPDDGEIYFDERVVHKLPPSERGVAMVFQEDGLWPGMSVAGNVAYTLSLRKVPRKDRPDRVAEALNALRLDSLARKRPEELSQAQRRRVELARALASRPCLLILDEPLGGLDPREADGIREDVRRLHAEHGLTTLVFTSRPREAMAQADRLTVMDLGRVVQSGLPAEVYNRPVSAFVAHFLGQTNLLQAQLDGQGGRGEVVVRTVLGRLVGQTSSAGQPGVWESPGNAPVTVSIRPEAFSIGASVLPGSNRFPATVERLTFLGEVREVRLRGPGDWPILATALQTQSQGLREGQSVTVSVAPEHVVVMPGKYAVPR